MQTKAWVVGSEKAKSLSGVPRGSRIWWFQERGGEALSKISLRLRIRELLREGRGPGAQSGQNWLGKVIAKRCRRKSPRMGEGRSLDTGGSPKRGSKLCPQGLGEETKGGRSVGKESLRTELWRGSGGQGGDLTPALLHPTSPGAGPSPGLVLRKRQL